jgi:hypothetical protein
MNLQKRFLQVIGVILIAVLVVGCNANKVEITFDGSNCTVTGPTSLSVGEHQFVLKNLSGKNFGFWVSRLKGDHTFQDLLDEQGEPGRYYLSLTNWVTLSSTTEYEYGNDGEAIYTIYLGSEGDYAIYLFDSATHEETWLCAPLQVN